jgi:hypothetical protein
MYHESKAYEQELTVFWITLGFIKMLYFDIWKLRGNILGSLMPVPASKSSFQCPLVHKSPSILYTFLPTRGKQNQSSRNEIHEDNGRLYLF